MLRAGRILEVGNRAGLLAPGGHSAELYTTYFRHQALAYLPPGVDVLAGKPIVRNP